MYTVTFCALRQSLQIVCLCRGLAQVEMSGSCSRKGSSPWGTHKAEMQQRRVGQVSQGWAVTFNGVLNADRVRAL